MDKRISISGLSGYQATTKDDLPSPPDPEYEYGSLAQGVKDMQTSPMKEISAKQIYEELQKYISDFALKSQIPKGVAAELKVELFRAAFPRGALSKKQVITGAYTFGVKEFLELQGYLSSLANTESIDQRIVAARERVKLFRAAFPDGIYHQPGRARSRSLLG